MNNRRTLFLLLICVLGYGCQSKTEYHWVNTSKGMELKYRDHKIGTFLHEAENKDISFTDNIEMIDSSFFQITRVYTATETIDSVHLSIAFEVNSCSHYTIIPSVNYNGNNWGRGKEPKGFQHDDQWWTVSFSATPIPGATYFEGDAYAVAMWGENPSRPEDAFSCSIQPEEDKTTHYLIYPEEEMPLFYSARDRYSDGFRRKMSLGKGATKTVIAYLHVSELKPQHRALHSFLRKAWQMAEHDSPTVFEPEKIWKYERGWCGQNASFGNSFLIDYLRTGDESSLKMGLTCLDTWADHAVLPNGLFITNFDYILENEKDATLDACNLGTATLNFFEAAELARQCKNERPAYEKIALNICRFVKDDQQASGVYGRGWKYDGECVYREGTVGCFLVPPMVEAFQRTKDKSYWESAIRAYNHYIKQLKIIVNLI